MSRYFLHETLRIASSHRSARVLLAGPLLTLCVSIAFLPSGFALAQRQPAAKSNGKQPAKPDGTEAKEAKKPAPLSLLERAPFDRIILDKENDNAKIDVLPIEKIPTKPKPTDRLRIRLLDEPEDLYEVEWRHIVDLKTYVDLVYAEAERLTAQKKYVEAFPYFAYLLKKQPQSIRLRRTILEYLLANARAMVTRKDYAYALSVLEELVQRDPNFQRAEVSKTLANVADQLITASVDSGNFRKARDVIQRMKRDYAGLNIESIDRWRQKLISMATDLKHQTEQQLAAGHLRDAERLGRRMYAIWPELAGAAELNKTIAIKYPMVIVGVSETSSHDDITSTTDWAARRTGWLTQRTLLEFVGAGPEGGQYLCSLGEFRQSDDRRSLTLSLNPDVAPQDIHVTGYDVVHRLLQRADPSNPDYNPSWAALFRRARVEDVFTVHVDLRRPHVLPEALLQIRLDAPADGKGPSPSDGPYVRSSKPVDGDTHFVLNPQFRFPKIKPPSEIVERPFGKSQDAIAALRRGDIDVIDYLFPADVPGLKAVETLNVQSYALPTIHVLIPNPNKPYTANQTFRRALVYGINRKTILKTEILGENKLPGCQVISGPFPFGTRDNDPLAYAYDTQIAPRSYYPRLASILKTLAKRELKEIAQKRDEDAPELKPLVLGYPSNEVARVACQAISQYLQVIGITCQLRELPSSAASDSSNEVDLLYAQIALWEPMIDARRLLAPAGIESVNNEYVGMALRRLDAAKNWRQVRSRLHELHRIAHEQVAVVPLWQTVDYFVYRKRLRGVGKQPLILYQNVEHWQVTPQSF